MTDETKPKQTEIEDLELNKETLQDLTEQEGDQARGGGIGQYEDRCTYGNTGCTGWGGPVGDTNRCVC